jgi:hypothetical protein
MRAIKFDVSEQLIRESLALPDDARIYDILRAPGPVGVFTFILTNPDYPVVAEASEPVTAYPIITADYEKKPSMWLKINLNIPT